MLRCGIAATMFCVVGLASWHSVEVLTHRNPVEVMTHRNPVEESYDMRHALRQHWTNMSKKHILLLHASKTGGTTSIAFLERCTNVTHGVDFLNKGYSINRFRSILKNTPERVVASHITSSKTWSRLLRGVRAEDVVFVSVRTWESWYRSAVMHVTARNCVAKPRCRVQEPACVITSEILQRFTKKREHELCMDLGSFFSAVEQLKSDGLLRTRIFLVDMHHMDVVYNLISDQFCPTVTAIKKNDHAVKAPVFLDSVDINGTCAEMSADESRSQVDLLSLNSTPYKGWQPDSIPTRVFEEGYWEYA